MTKVVLTVDHTHDGKLYKAGSEIEVDDVTAKWMVAQNPPIAQRVTAPTAQVSTKAPEKANAS